MAMQQAVIAAVMQAMGQNPRVLPFSGFVDGNDTLVTAGEDDEAVALEQGALRRTMHGIVKRDHCHGIGALPGLAPAVPVLPVFLRALVVIGKNQRDAAVPAGDINVGQKLVLAVEQLPAETVVVWDVMGDCEGDPAVPG